MIGWYLVSQVAIVVLLMPLAHRQEIYNYKTLSPFAALYDLIGYAILIGGVGFGLWFVRKRNVFYHVLWPNRTKLTTAAALTAVIGVGLLMFSYEIRSWWGWASSAEITRALLWDIPKGLFLGIIYIYPFAALMNYTVRRWREGPRQGLWRWLVLGLLINPYFCTIGTRVDRAIDFYSEYFPCGTQVYVMEDMPAERAGMQTGEIITEVDGVKTVLLEVLLNYTRQIKTSDPWHITTDRGEYSIVPEFKEYNERYMIGVQLNQGYCNDKGEVYGRGK